MYISFDYDMILKTGKSKYKDVHYNVFNSLEILSTTPLAYDYVAIV